MPAAGVHNVKRPVTVPSPLGAVGQRQHCRQNMFEQESTDRPSHTAQAQGLVVDHRVAQSSELVSDTSESQLKSVAQTRDLKKEIPCRPDSLAAVRSWSPATGLKDDL